MRPELERVVERLLAGTSCGEVISIDRIGDALDVIVAGSPEIEWVFGRLEAAGRVIGSDQGGRGEADLRVVIATAREHRQRTGRVPTPADLASATGLAERDVAYALALEIGRAHV